MTPESPGGPELVESAGTATAQHRESQVEFQVESTTRPSSDPLPSAAPSELPADDPLAQVRLALPRDVRIEEMEPWALGSSTVGAPGSSVRPTLPTPEGADEHQLERVVAQRSLRTSGGARVARHGSNVAIVNPRAAFFARSGVLVSAMGNTAELDMMRVVPLGLPTQGGWMRIRSADQVVLQARAPAKILPIGLAEQELVVSGYALLGFDEGLLRGSMVSDALPDAGLIKMSGNGTVVIQSNADLMSLPVLPGRTTTARPANLLGWWGRVRIEVGTDDEAEEGLVVLRGQGAALLDVTSEGEA